MVDTARSSSPRGAQASSALPWAWARAGPATVTMVKSVPLPHPLITRISLAATLSRQLSSLKLQRSLMPRRRAQQQRVDHQRRALAAATWAARRGLESARRGVDDHRHLRRAPRGSRKHVAQRGQRATLTTPMARSSRADFALALRVEQALGVELLLRSTQKASYRLPRPARRMPRPAIGNRLAARRARRGPRTSAWSPARGTNPTAEAGREHHRPHGRPVVLQGEVPVARRPG